MKPKSFTATACLRSTFLAAWLLTLVCIGCGSAGEEDSNAGLWVEIRGQRVEVELARTRQQQSRGLSFRDELPWDHGMLFLYKEPGFYGFWMKDMRFEIDIVWIRDDRIVDITRRIPPPAEDGPLMTYRPNQLTSMVLEVPADYASARNWTTGDRVSLSPDLRGELH